VSHGLDGSEKSSIIMAFPALVELFQPPSHSAAPAKCREITTPGSGLPPSRAQQAGKLVDPAQHQVYTREFSNLFCTPRALLGRSFASGYCRLRCQSKPGLSFSPRALARVIHVVSLLD
jgi:hypothetical protein